MTNDITKMDKNLVVNESVDEAGMAFYDIRREPFSVYGLYDYRNQPEFRRMPNDVAETVSENVKKISRNTAGGRVRFATDSDVIAIKAVMTSICRLSQSSLVGFGGFDLYVDDPESGVSRFHRAFIPPFKAKDEYESEVKFNERKLRYITINFPPYSSVKDLFVGIKDDAFLGEGAKYKDVPPIVYYGSSITQGGFVSRPGNAYQNMICRRNNIDYINLGFSGSGKAEDTMIEYLASLDMSAFVCDYDHNAPDPEHLKNTHYKLYEGIRKSHPTIPYIIITKPDFDSNYVTSIPRRNVIFDTYRRARDEGDLNVYYIDGASIFRGRFEDCCTVDGTHPNDLGFAYMADAIDAELRRAWTQNNIT
ncbi:MAG: hypothetical protein E7653_07710 [Ruminococcaceae bacterium]|nr:hypothetical protein [Oscillospiraceae bacterium]